MFSYSKWSTTEYVHISTIIGILFKLGGIYSVSPLMANSDASMILNGGGRIDPSHNKSTNL